MLVWTYSEHLAIDHGVCPRCAGTFSFDLEVCEGHDPVDGICAACRRRYGITVRSTCRTCHHFRVHLLTDYVFYRPTVRPFFERHGIDPVLPAWEDLAAFYDVRVDLRSTDPFEARLTYAVGGESLVVAVDGDLATTVVEAGEPAPEGA